MNEFVKVRKDNTWYVYQAFMSETFTNNIITIHLIYKCDNSKVLHIGNLYELPEGIEFAGTYNSSFKRNTHNTHIIFDIERRPEFISIRHIVDKVNDIINVYQDLA